MTKCNCFGYARSDQACVHELAALQGIILHEPEFKPPTPEYGFEYVEPEPVGEDVATLILDLLDNGVITPPDGPAIGMGEGTHELNDDGSYTFTPLTGVLEGEG